MTARIAANQLRTFLALFAALRPHLADARLPLRLREALARHRGLGARDRRLYREFCYTAWRYLPWVETGPGGAPVGEIVAWLAPDTRDTGACRAALLAGWPPVPAGLAAKAAVLAARFPTATFAPEALLPDWLREDCPASLAAPHLEALLTRAPLWVRLQTPEPDSVLAEFQALGWAPRPFPGLPEAWALPPDAAVDRTAAHLEGRVEIQDLGSQLVLRHLPDLTGQVWLDACAGAGGKTLALARAVGLGGRVDAADPRPAALAELRVRAARAGLANIRVQTAAGSGAGAATPAYDGVLVDAPCSGSGTWRRQPHLKWSTTPRALAVHAAAQLAILRAHAPAVRPGGWLVYATCSLSRRENHGVVAAFLATQPDFAAAPPTRAWGGAWDGLGTTLLPGTHDTDGFYVALLRRQR